VWGLKFNPQTQTQKLYEAVCGFVPFFVEPQVSHFTHGKILGDKIL
jgi:hypothetical protein